LAVIGVLLLPGANEVRADARQPPKKAATAPTMRVVVEGAGTTPEEALRSAFRSAVRQVIGTLVDSETRIENGKLVYDRLLTHSQGYIARYEVLDEWTDGPLFHQKIAAVVRRNSLGRRLGMTTVDAARLDGPTLFARAASQYDREASAAQQLALALARFPVDVAQVCLASGAEVVNRSASSVTLSQPLRLGVDHQRYARARELLLQLLELVAQERGTFVAQMRAVSATDDNADLRTLGLQFAGACDGTATGDSPADVRFSPLRSVVATRNTRLPYAGWTPGQLDADQLLVVVRMETSSVTNVATWRWFRIDRPAGLTAARLQISLKFRDEALGTVREQTFALGTRTPGFSVGGEAGQMTSILIAPELTYHAGSGYRATCVVHASTLTFARQITLPLEDLLRVRHVECSVGEAVTGAEKL
jgi:hypothetical protein